MAIMNPNGIMTTKFEVINAVDALKLPVTVGLNPENMGMNIIMVISLCFIFIFGTVFALKKKDML